MLHAAYYLHTILQGCTDIKRVKSDRNNNNKLVYLFPMSKESKVVHRIYIHLMAFMLTESKVD